MVSDIIRQYIASNRLKEALSELEQEITSNSLKDELLMLLSRYNNLQTGIRKKTISHENVEITLAQIKDSFLNLLVEIEEDLTVNHNAEKVLEKLTIKEDNALPKYLSRINWPLIAYIFLPLVLCFILLWMSGSSWLAGSGLKYKGPIISKDKVEFYIINRKKALIQDTISYQFLFKITSKNSSISFKNRMFFNPEIDNHPDNNISYGLRSKEQILSDNYPVNEMDYTINFRKAGVYIWYIPINSNIPLRHKEHFDFKIIPISNKNIAYPDKTNSLIDYIYIYQWKILAPLLLVFYSLLIIFQKLFKTK